MRLIKVLAVCRKFCPALALSLLAITLNACASSDGAKESSGTFESPLDGMYPRTVGDWSEVRVTAIALCHPNDYWVIQVDGLATGGDGQSLDRYIEGIVRPDGVIVRPKAYYLDNPGPYCPGEGGPSVGDAVGIPDVVKGARQTAWIWFEGIRDFITADESSRLILILTDNGFSTGNRYYIRPWNSSDPKVESGTSASPDMSGRVDLATMQQAITRQLGEGICGAPNDDGIVPGALWERKLLVKLPEISANQFCDSFDNKDAYFAWFPTEIDLDLYLESVIAAGFDAGVDFSVNNELHSLNSNDDGDILIGNNGMIAYSENGLANYQLDWGNDWILVSNWGELFAYICLRTSCPTVP